MLPSTNLLFEGDQSFLLSILVACLLVLMVIRVFRRRGSSIVPTTPYVLVSGCDTGIGREAALALAARGCRVFAGCLKPDAAGLPDSVEVVPLDITCKDSIREAVSVITKRLGTENAELWAVVNNAGLCIFGPFEWQTSQQVERQVVVNVLGTMALTKACIPLLKPLKGRVVTLTSVNGVLSYPGLSVYSATKFALEGFLRALRIELRPQGLRVVTVRPGDYARATGIMATHTHNAKEMWDALPPQQRDECALQFQRFHESAIANCGLSSPDTLEGSPILRDIQSAILDEKVPSLYVSAPLHQRIVYSLMTMVPESWSDSLIGYVYSWLSSPNDATRCEKDS